MSAEDAAHNHAAILKVERMTQDIFAGCVVEALRSIKFGSELTGALGQPVDTAKLRNSWLFEFEGPMQATIGTPVEYATPVEDAVGPYGAVAYGRKNGIGGSHSVKKTVAGFNRIVDAMTERFGGGAT